MKKTFLLIAVLLLTGACATPPPANRETAPPAAASPAAVAMTEAAAIAKEKAIWDTIKNKDWDAFGNMLADDQVEVTADRFGKIERGGVGVGLAGLEIFRQPVLRERGQLHAEARLDFRAAVDEWVIRIVE